MSNKQTLSHDKLTRLFLITQGFGAQKNSFRDFILTFPNRLKYLWSDVKACDKSLMKIIDNAEKSLDHERRRKKIRFKEIGQKLKNQMAEQVEIRRCTKNKYETIGKTRIEGEDSEALLVRKQERSTPIS